MRTFALITSLLIACGGESAVPVQADLGAVQDGFIEYDLSPSEDSEIEADAQLQSADLTPSPDLGREDSQAPRRDLSADSTQPDAGVDVGTDLGSDSSPPDLGLDSMLPDSAQDAASITPDTLQPDSQLPDSQAPDVDLKGTQWVIIQAGGYQMGQDSSDACPIGATGKVYTVVKRFEIMQYEMTKRQRALLKPPQPWTDCGNQLMCPAAAATWSDAAMACNALSVSAGLSPCYSCTGPTCSAVQTDLTQCGYRLPTRAEFEFAYRAGTTTEFYNGAANPTKCIGATKADYIAWYDWNSSGQAHEIGQKQPNTWGIYDLAGNVEEWTHDTCANGKITMGGSFSSPSHYTQAGVTQCVPLTQKSQTIGFRCARSL